MLYASFSKDVNEQTNGHYVTSWGRLAPPRGRQDLVDECEAGKEGNAHKFWQWCEKQVEPYA